ncbi:TPA: hypothetical protein HA238_05190 [Candidatus Micrarchaeota archaeon]|nr:hypothetical protein [Candidatus Micrarchaeota archaeon]
MRSGTKFLIAGAACAVVAGTAYLLLRHHKDNIDPENIRHDSKPAAVQRVAAQKFDSSKAGWVGQLNSKPHVYLDRDCVNPQARESWEKDIKFMYYDALESGLALVRGTSEQYKPQTAIKIYEMTIYETSAAEARSYLQTIQNEFFNKGYAHPLLAVLGYLRLTDSTPQNESSLANALFDVAVNPSVPENLRVQALTCLRERGKIASVRQEIVDGLRSLLLDSSKPQAVRKEAGNSCLIIGLKDVGGAPIEVMSLLNRQGGGAASLSSCILSDNLRAFVTLMVQYVSKHSNGVSEDAITSVLKDHFMAVLSDRGVSPGSNRGRGYAGSFADGILDLVRSADAFWVAGHETTHAFAYHLRMGRVDYDSSAFRAKFGGYNPSIYCLAEFSTQQIVNQVIADFLNVPVKLVPLFVDGYGDMLRSPAFQETYRMAEAKLGGKAGFARAFFFGSVPELNGAFEDAIAEIYGDNASTALEIIKGVIPSSGASVSDAAARLGRLRGN